jgi:hypothetical protein
VAMRRSEAEFGTCGNLGESVGTGILHPKKYATSSCQRMPKPDGVKVLPLRYAYLSMLKPL